MNLSLHAWNLKFSYGGRSQGVFSLSLGQMEVVPGEIHALIGPNGCGKSTLLRLMAGIHSPFSGDIRLGEKNLGLFSRQELAQRLAFLPQQVNPIFSLRVWEMVLAGRHPWLDGLGLARSEDVAVAEKVMRRMGILDLRERNFDTLSGGERQKVLLASILAQEPRVILLDEPTAFLDVHHQIEVFQLLRGAVREGVAVLMATHDLTLAGHFADRLTLMQSGQDVCTGTAWEVLEEKRLQKVYGEQLRVSKDPVSGLPCVLPSVSGSDQDASCKTAPTEGSRPTHCGNSCNEPQQIVGRVPSRGGLREFFKGFQGVKKTGPEAGKTAAAGLTESESQDQPSDENSMQGTIEPLTAKRFLSVVGLFALVFLLAAGTVPWIGGEKVDGFHSIREMISMDRDHWSVSTQILAMRLPRVTMGLLAGMALGCVGAAFQSLLRNPLAEPYTLGIASTAALGAVIPLSYPFLGFALGPISGVQLWAFGFALASVGFLRMVNSRHHWGWNVTSLLLMGITLGLISAAMIMLIRFLANPLTLHAMDQWMVGGVEVAGWRDVIPVLPFLIPGLALLLTHGRNLNQIALGDEMAVGRGVDVQRVQRGVFMGGSLVTASVVAVVGPIGFVGLIIPHMVRKLVGTDQRLVLPGSLFTGGIVLVLADALARCLSIGGRGAELPVGILTSLVGGPIFLGLLLGRRGR